MGRVDEENQNVPDITPPTNETFYTQQYTYQNPQTQQPTRPDPFPPQNYPPRTQQQPPQAVQFPPPPPNPVGPVSGNPIMGTPAQNQFSTPQVQVRPQGWMTGLCGCLADPCTALITAIVPCVTFGQIAEILDMGKTSCGTSGFKYCCICWSIAVPCLMSCTYRAKLRALFGLPASPAPDCIVHCCCEYCALCQAYRELKARGIDPSTGWIGNAGKVEQLQRQRYQQQQQEAMMPPMKQTMRG